MRPPHPSSPVTWKSGRAGATNPCLAHISGIVFHGGLGLFPVGSINFTPILERLVLAHFIKNGFKVHKSCPLWEFLDPRHIFYGDWLDCLYDIYGLNYNYRMFPYMVF